MLIQEGPKGLPERCEWWDAVGPLSLSLLILFSAASSLQMSPDVLIAQPPTRAIPAHGRQGHFTTHGGPLIPQLAAIEVPIPPGIHLPKPTDIFLSTCDLVGGGQGFGHNFRPMEFLS